MIFSTLAFLLIVKPYREGRIKKDFYLLIPLGFLVVLMILGNLNHLFGSGFLQFLIVEETAIYFLLLCYYAKDKKDREIKEEIEKPGKRIATQIVDLLYSEILIKREEAKILYLTGKTIIPTMILPSNHDIEWEIEKSQKENQDRSYLKTNPGDGSLVTVRKFDFFTLEIIQQQLYQRIVDDPDLQDDVKKEAFIRYKKGEDC